VSNNFPDRPVPGRSRGRRAAQLVPQEHQEPGFDGGPYPADPRQAPELDGVSGDGNFDAAQPYDAQHPGVQRSGVQADAPGDAPSDEGRYHDGGYYDAEHAPAGQYYDEGHPDDRHFAGHYDEGHPDDPHSAGHYDDAGHPVFPAEDVPSRRVRRTSKRVRRRRRTLVMLVVVAGFLAVAFFAFQLISPMLSPASAKDYPGPGHGSVMFTVDPGSSGRSVATQLVQQGVVESEGAFLDALTKANGTALIQPGSFQMKLEMKASDAVSTLLSADENKVHYAAIAQNLRQPEVLALLAKSTGIPQDKFDALAKNPAAFGLPAQAKTLEGYLAPGEYRFAIDMTAQQILTKLVQTTKDELTQAGVTDSAEQYKDLTIGSIIEFEGNEANYGLISGAIENRLNNPSAETGGRLESDATVAYGLGIKSYNITDAQKKDASNLYNTFVRPGLPVGPIGSPKQKAIEAAAHPQANPYYFWVTVNLDTGETLYATTYADHLKNVAKYQSWCDANAGKCK
jgi:UPF0755 protein